jgi:adenosylcobyric acid synthase
MTEKKATCLSIFGTASDVGKSIVTTALCRVFSRQGIQVAPFKAQNMSNNSGVTPEGLEMGRAQVVQAEAARIAPHVDMNPVLLKPTGETGSQVILNGKVLGDQSAADYYQHHAKLFNEAQNALDRLRKRFDLVVMEGAGSCAEMNLISRDIVNFPMAVYADSPVVLVADIHRGGVFAQIIGTLECLPNEYRDRVIGCIINRFRGDVTLFEEGQQWIEHRTGVPVLGVLPWFSHFTIQAEDSVAIENPKPIPLVSDSQPCIAVIRLPHISNFTDFDPLSAIPGLQVQFIEEPQSLNHFKAVIVPGSKNTRSDLRWLHETGWTRELKALAGSGGSILGICGGYQMLGLAVDDPDGLEGQPGQTMGLGLLPVETILKAPKTTTLTRFSWQAIQGTGYEIHMGQTTLMAGQPAFKVSSRNRRACADLDGCISPDGKIMGTYMHGLFDTPEITAAWLDRIGLGHLQVTGAQGPLIRDKSYELLADHFETYVDIQAIIEKIGAINSALSRANQNTAKEPT